MAQQLINIGSAANDHTGDSFRTGAQKINANFTELYSSTVIPAQTGNSGLFLSTDGTTLSWQTPVINNVVLTTNSYADPSWITSLSYAKINGAPTPYTLPTASTSVIGGVKVDGTSITISGTGVISSPPQIVPTATTSTLGVVKVDGTTITLNGSSQLVATQTTIARTTASGTTQSIAASAFDIITITGFKSYALLSITVSSAAWVSVYTSVATQVADVSRSKTTDPTPGSGVIAEVITTSAGTQKFTPMIFGFNDETVPNNNIQLKVYNNGGSAAAITVTLNLIKLES